MDYGGAGVQHELPPGVRDHRFPDGAAEELHPSRGRGGTHLRFLRSVEGIRGGDRRPEDLWIKTVVHPCGGSAGKEEIQGQFAEEVFSEGIFDLGMVNPKFSPNLPYSYNPDNIFQHYQNRDFLRGET